MGETGGDVREILNAEGVDTGESSPALPEALTPQGAPPGQDKAKLIFGKFKDIKEAEKGYKSAEQKLTETSQRQKKLDAILNNPELKKWAATNPELKKALTEAGYSLAEIEAAEEREKAKKEGNTDWSGDENDVNYRMMLFERKFELREQKAGIEQELKRPMKPEEWEETKEMMKTVNPTMDARLAWKLTKAYENMLKDRESQAVAKARGPSKNGTRPPPNLLPSGMESNVQKRPSKMNAHERDNFLRDIVRETT